MTQRYTSISSDLCTTSSFNALSRCWRYGHNLWPKSNACKKKTFNPMYYWAENKIIEMGVLHLNLDAPPSPTWERPDASWWHHHISHTWKVSGAGLNGQYWHLFVAAVRDILQELYATVKHRPPYSTSLSPRVSESSWLSASRQRKGDIDQTGQQSAELHTAVWWHYL